MDYLESFSMVFCTVIPVMILFIIFWFCVNCFVDTKYRIEKILKRIENLEAIVEKNENFRQEHNFCCCLTEKDPLD